MTKFILHGGFNSEKPNEDSSAFYREILKDTPYEVKILFVPFAKDEDRIPFAIAKVAKEFEDAAEGRRIFVSTATEDNFINQAQGADVLYFHGGVTLKLLEALRKYPELESLIKEKIVAGESAGANVWCKYFYSPHADGAFEGLGLLPFKLIPHYKEEFAGKLDGTDQRLETIFLPEYQYRVFEV